MLVVAAATMVILFCIDVWCILKERRVVKRYFQTLKFADQVENVPLIVSQACKQTRFMKNDKLVMRFHLWGESLWRLEVTEGVVTNIRWPV